MKRVHFIFIVLTTFFFIACGTTSVVPITGRKHNLIVSDAQILSLSNSEYHKFMASARMSANTRATAMVRRVGQRLAQAVERFLVENGNAAEVKNFQWEFNLVADAQRNAFCMPGGKIVVFEGILPVTQDEASLAIVLGHEIAHAVAKHSAEQMSKKIRQKYGTQIGYGILKSMGTKDDAVMIAQIVAEGYFSLRNLSYSRDNENEADHMGLIFAAMAGYDPTSAIGFWQRMAALSGNNGTDMMSSHPSDEKRIANIRRLMPQALKYYRQTQGTTTEKRRYNRNNRGNIKSRQQKSISVSDLYNNYGK